MWDLATVTDPVALSLTPFAMRCSLRSSSQKLNYTHVPSPRNCILASVGLGHQQTWREGVSFIYLEWDLRAGVPVKGEDILKDFDDAWRRREGE